jgi:hypothetical protein
LNKGKRRILFDRPKPTAGCSANGREEEEKEEEEEEYLNNLKLQTILGTEDTP